MIPRRTNYIRTPWRQRLLRLRQTALPVVGFFACVAAALWLWQRQGLTLHGVGEVELVQVAVASGADGVLTPLPRGPWTLLDRIEANTVLARLDDRPVRAEMETLRAELARLRSEYVAAREQYALDESARRSEHAREGHRLAWQVQQHRLDLLDRRALIETDRVTQTRLESELGFLEPLLPSHTVTEMEVTDQRMQREEVRKRIAENERSLLEAKQQFEQATAAARAFGDLRAMDADKLLAPVTAAITVGERQLDELQVRIDALVIRAPIAGVICAIHAWPGQQVSAGDPVVSVAADTGRYIVSYVRQEQRLCPQVGMPVAVRARGAHGPPVESVVERVGPQVEPVPPHQLRDPKLPEWGQPVCIRVPERFPLRPGELIEVMFQRPARLPSL